MRRPTLRYFRYQIVSLGLYWKIPTTLSVAAGHHPRTQHLLTQDNLHESLNLCHGKNDTWQVGTASLGDHDDAIPDVRSYRAQTPADLALVCLHARRRPCHARIGQHQAGRAISSQSGAVHAAAEFPLPNTQ